ncbi:unnamed protein product, partial [Rotaria sordida]
MESTKTVEKEKRYHDEELLEEEKAAGEIYKTDEYEIEQQPTGADVHVKSPHESDHEEEEEEEQYERERKRSIDEVIAETPEIIEHEKSLFERLHSDEQTRTPSREEIEADESEPIDRRELLIRLSSQKTEIEYIPFSEPEDQEDEFQRSPERKLSSEKTIIEPTPLVEHEQEQKDYERPLSPEHVLKKEKEIPERKLSFEKSTTESPDLSEQEEDQYIQKYETEFISSADKIKIEPTEIVEEDRHEQLLTSQQQFIEHPEVDIQHKDEKEDHYELEEKLTIDKNIIEPLETAEEQEKHDEEEQFESEKQAGETHEVDEYEMEQKSSGINIHLESPHESEDEQEEDQYEPKYETEQYPSESLISPEKMEIEHTETVEKDRSEPLETSTQQVIESP